MDRPEVHFAWNGGNAIAYQIVGQGPIDLLYIQGYASQLDVNWESPHLSRFLRGLARDARLIVMDRRGWGLSERFTPGDVSDIDAMTDDLVTVLDAAGSERAAIVATFDCTPVAFLFAAAHPERAVGLVVIDPWVSYAARPDTPWMPTPAAWEEVMQHMREDWGTAAWTVEWTDPREAEWFRRLQRAATSPGALVAEARRYLDTDVSAVLPTIHVPTLVMLDRDGEWDVPPETGRFVAAQIGGARLVEHSSSGGLHRVHWYARADAILEEIHRFLRRIRDEELSFDRVLATVLFTDIVASAAASARMGDRAWGDLLGRHNAAIRSLLSRYRGHEVDTAGDGFFATFDGPARAVRCALAIGEAVRPLGLQIRAGLHTGEVQTGGGKVTGTAVNVGARIAAVAEASEVLVSQTVRDLVAGSGLEFSDRGVHDLKGIPDPWRLYAASQALAD